MAVGLLLGAASAVAADASGWVNDSYSAVRLVGGRVLGQAGGWILRAGIEFKLQPGWKTYWRYPGDSGVPPVFNFAGSENVRSITVLWPAPERFSDGISNSLGYRDSVILPLRVVPQNENKPVLLRLKLDYAVCKTLCMPAKADVELVLSGKEGAAEAALAAAEARVPKPAALGQRGPLAIWAIRRIPGASPPRIMVDVTALPAARVDLFAEGPTPQWSLPLPEPLPATDAALRRFAFDLDGLPPGASPEGAILKLTAVSTAQAIEVEYRLD